MFSRVARTSLLSLTRTYTTTATVNKTITTNIPPITKIITEEQNRIITNKPPPIIITEEQKRLVKATAPVFQQRGKEITTHFYQRMFRNHPELKNVFNLAHQQTGAQPTALADALFAYAANIDNLGALSKAVSLIANKHASLQIIPQQYPIVGENLLASVKEVLGDAVDTPTLTAWQAAYQQIANILIDAEAKLYKEAADVDGGWAGWRKFRVAKKEIESEEIISFYLQPVDHGKLPAYKPGQFISVKKYIPELGYEQPRQYSLSAAPNNSYLRISVKRESGQENKPHGKMSNLLHAGVQVGTEIDVSPPFGDFHINLNATSPVVLISGGVGLTPMISMLDTVLSAYSPNSPPSSKRKVVFVHGARNRRVHAMRAHSNALIRQHADHVARSIWYEDAADAIKGEDYDHVGRIEVSKAKDEIVIPDADYYLCGPLPFMVSMEKQLVENGVRKERIHSEAFGEAVSYV